MANEKQLIDAKPLMQNGWHLVKTGESNRFICSMSLADVPTVDAVEVVHGQWLFVTKGQQTSVYVCSKCNMAVTVVCDEDIREEQLAKKYPYCHCGARMDGDWNG